VQHPELIAERIVRFSRIVGREHVAALAEGARLATRRLWGRA